MSELIERFYRQVLILALMRTGTLPPIIIDGNLSGCIRKSNGQLAGRIDSSCQNAASGLPPAMPGCQISTMASQTGSRRQSSNGRPLERISTIGLPVFFSSIANFSCIFGKAMEAREAFSPLQFRFSPRQSRMTSAFPAVATARQSPIHPYRQSRILWHTAVVTSLSVPVSARHKFLPHHRPCVSSPGA